MVSSSSSRAQITPRARFIPRAGFMLLLAGGVFGLAGCVQYAPASAEAACAAMAEEGCYGPEDGLSPCIRNLGEDRDDLQMYDAGACADERGILMGCLVENAREACAADRWFDACPRTNAAFTRCQSGDG